jgi:two-component system chemotaxis response regulator CheY
MLAADRLFKASNDAETLNRILNAPIPPLQESGAVVPAPIEAVCRRALAREPSERFSTAAEFGDELERVARSLGAIATSRDLATLVEAAIAPEGTQRDSVRAWAVRTGAEAGPPSSPPSSRSQAARPPRLSGVDASPSSVREHDRTPLPRVRAHGPVTSEATRVVPSATPRQRRLLTIDDSPTVRKLIRVFLMGMEFEFIEAATAQLGLTALAESPVDLVIVDVNMPEMDGLAFLRAVRASPDAAVRRVPIVLLTGDKSARTRASAAEMGASGFVLKPVTSSTLRETITELLRPGSSRT